MPPYMPPDNARCLQSCRQFPTAARGFFLRIGEARPHIFICGRAHKGPVPVSGECAPFIAHPPLAPACLHAPVANTLLTLGSLSQKLGDWLGCPIDGFRHSFSDVLGFSGSAARKQLAKDNDAQGDGEPQHRD